MKTRIYLDYVQDILDSIRDIEDFVKGMRFEEFKADPKTVNAVVRSIEVIGEASKDRSHTVGIFAHPEH